ncbi:MAG: fatty acid--CoA ligase family protein [Clostridiales bacterium]|nr:fatty acid--CoA ligase family protein [Clostridiales bacterium]
MRLWEYLAGKMHPFADRVAFANGHITYADLLQWGRTAKENRRPRVCEGQTREAQAIAILRCIAEGDVAVPVSAEYGSKHSGRVKTAVHITQENMQDLAFVMFTSGTTGTPKGVMLTDTNVIENLAYISEYFRVSEFRTICIARPLMHVAVITGELLYALCNGLTVYFYEEPFMPQRVLSYFAEHGIEVFCATPTLYRTLAKARGTRDFPVRAGVLSGEILSEAVGREIADAFPQTEFYNVYGLTEHSPRVTALTPDQFRLRPNSIGKPIGNVRITIADGELLVRSPCVMKGYYGDRQKTAQKICDGWLHTGDAAHVDEEGYLYIDGRKDNMLIRCGLNIYPEEIERTAKECPQVTDCVAYGMPTEQGTLICLNYTGAVTPAELRKFLAANGNLSAIPDRIGKVAQLARTPSGKIQRK